MEQSALDFSTTGKSEDELREIASSLVEAGWCHRCIGRQFARCGRGVENPDRGEVFMASYGSAGAAPSPEEDCTLCRGLFDRIDAFTENIIAELRNVESGNFLVGTVIDFGAADREKAMTEMSGLNTSEPMKGEMNRLIGKRVSIRLDLPVEFNRPEIVTILDSRFGTVTLQISPIFISGRYRKHSRGIPQTRWFCRKCRGKGCSYCGGTGKMYDESVEELVGGPVLETLDGEGHFFHGMGREDIDARMLGNGRPFVLEIRNPMKRSADLSVLENLINTLAEGKIEVEGLAFTSRDKIVSLKESRSAKSYRAEVEFEGPVDMERFNNVMDCLSGKHIAQRTPTRVKHRRADLSRERTVFDMTGKMLDDRRAVIEIKGEAGIYIKELINGDEGRTVPSVTELTGVPCMVTTLDVIYIHDEPAGDGGSLSSQKSKEP